MIELQNKLKREAALELLRERRRASRRAILDGHGVNDDIDADAAADADGVHIFSVPDDRFASSIYAYAKAADGNGIKASTIPSWEAVIAIKNFENPVFE